MTTNHPEKLDEALIRPGRVDHQVAFSNATQHQIKELFERMYNNDLPRTKLIMSSSQPGQAQPEDEKKTTANGHTTSSTTTNTLTPPATPVTGASATTSKHVSFNGYAKASGGVTEKQQGADISEFELHKIAEAFAVQVPNNMFSPAEIQGFLLKRKKDPRRALEEVRPWVEGMVEVKRKGSKLVSVQ